NPVGAQSVQSALDMPHCTKPSKRVWFLGNNPLYNPNRIDANVPGARNMLEMIGVSPYASLVPAAQKELDDNYKEPTAHYTLYRLYSEQERKRLLLGKLFRADCHALTKLAAEGPKVVATFTGKKAESPRDAKEIIEKAAKDSVQQLLAEFNAIQVRD